LYLFHPTAVVASLHPAVVALPFELLPVIAMSHGNKTFPQEHAEEMEMDDRQEMAGTAKDAQEMDRLGRQQQLNVRSMPSMLSLDCY